MVQASTVPALDFLRLPLDSVAAYWLSLRKLAGNAKNLKALEQEAQFVAEPFVRHLLDMAVNAFPVARFNQLAAVSAAGELSKLNRQLDLMRIAVLDIAQGENPLRTLARMSACFLVLGDAPEKLLEEAQARVSQAAGRKMAKESYALDHRQPDGALAATLLFYAVLARRHGKAACRPFLAHAGSVFFTDGLALVIDGFDVPFVRKWLKKFKTAILADVQRKMELSTNLCAAILERQPFEDLRYLVRSYLR
jgi:hypothetical protein